MTAEIWIAIITGFFTLIGSGLLSYFIAKRKNRRDDFVTISDLIKEDNSRLRLEIDKIREENNAIRLELDSVKEELIEERERGTQIRSDLLLLETAHHDLPLPQWLKDENGIMLSLNDAYEDAFLLRQNKTRSDYIGRTDTEFWGLEIGLEHQKNDRIALRKRRATIFHERIEVDGADLSGEFIVLKYPRYKGRVLIGIGGIYFPVSYYEIASKRKSL